MSKALKRYRELESELAHVRWIYRGQESEGEEGIVEALAEAWYGLSEEEQAQIRSEGPKTLLAEGSALITHHEWWECDPTAGTSGARREFREVA